MKLVFSILRVFSMFMHCLIYNWAFRDSCYFLVQDWALLRNKVKDQRIKNNRKGWENWRTTTQTKYRGSFDGTYFYIFLPVWSDHN